jgi:hypothetical protein
MENKNNRASVILGTLLLAAGVLALLGQVIGPRFGGEFWPFIVIGVGLAFFVAMLVGGRAFGALAIPGSIITGIGLILLIQNTFNLWETWSFAWALIICSVGIGLVIFGTYSENEEVRQSGWNVARIGLILFIVFGILMEFVFVVMGVSTSTSSMFWPILLVAIGLIMLVVRSYRLIRREETRRGSDNNLFWPVIFIGIGLLWLMVNLNIITTSDVSALISLWPVLLVAAGIDIIIGRRHQWVNLLLGVAVVAGMYYVVFNNDRLGLASRAPWAILGVNFESGAPINEWVAGSGTMVEEEREVGDFDQIVLTSSGELIIEQGQETSLMIEAEDNLLPYITTEVVGGRLVIAAKPGVGFTTTQSIHYYITVQDLSQVSVSGAGAITTQDITTPELGVSLSGYGNVKMENLQTDLLTATISGSGTYEVTGETDQLDVNISGAGGFNGEDLRAREVKVVISGVGRAVVWATELLEPRISGVGSVSYYGSPEVHQTTSGIGNVRKLGEK